MKEYHIKIPSPDKRKRHNLFVVAFNHFPENLAATAVGIAFLSAPLLYNLFREQGISSVIVRIILTGAVIAIVPLLILYLVTLLRSVGIREKLESQNEDELK